MTGPNIDRHPFDEGVLLEDLEKEFPAPTPDSEKPKVDPTVEALLADRQRMEKIMQDLATANRPAPAPAPVPQIEPEPTYDRGAIKQLLEEGNMMEAMEAMLGFAYKKVSRDFEERIRPLANTTVTVAEQSMRQRYPDEFELFGDEIGSLARQAGTNLSTPEAWESLIGYVRGRGSNFDKLVEYKTNKRSRKDNTEDFPPSISAGALRGSSPQGGGRGGKPTKEELANDPAVQKMLRASGMSLDEYIRWF